MSIRVSWMYGLSLCAAGLFFYAAVGEAQASPPLDALRSVDVPAGPIWNQKDAERVCPAVCTAAGGRWNGQWRTTIPGKASVCGCV